MDSIDLYRVPFQAAQVGIIAPHGRQYTLSIDKAEARESDMEHLFATMSVRDRRRREMYLRARQQDFGFQWAIKPSVDHQQWFHRYLPTSRLLDLDTGREEISEESLDIGFERLMERHWLDFYSSLQAKIRDHQQQCIADILRTVIAGRHSDAATVDVSDAYSKTLAFLRRQTPRATLLKASEFERKLKTDDLFRSVIARISRVEDEIARTLAPRTQLDELIHRMFSGPKALKFEDQRVEVTGVDEQPIGLRSLSSGEKQLLFLLVEIMRAGDSAVMIDEPELSMHVDWQREFIQSAFDLNPSCQLLVATHSPDVMALVDEQYIYEMPS